jgi:predicted NBD/HSP70 family sugar kinase
MDYNDSLPLPAPRVTPALDPGFRPAVLANRDFRELVASLPNRIPVTLALEQQTSGNVSQFHTAILPDNHPVAAANWLYLERIAKFLLWSRGGSRLHVSGSRAAAEKLRQHYEDTATGRFDSEIVSGKMFDHPLQVVFTDSPPPVRTDAAPLGRHLEGCRIGFDLGGSDRKAAAVVDGKVIFSEEIAWNPYFEKDPRYHYDGIMDSLSRAAAHLPRVDAIGGSAAGIYVQNRVKVASLFRGVGADDFDRKVKNMFLDIRRAWKNVPFEVVNDGEVTALAGSMSLGCNAILGLSFGTSTAGGWVNGDGNITSWINELAFMPVDYRLDAPRDEWSGDYGCGVQYFSQQAVGRLLGPAGIEQVDHLGLPEKLKHVQKLMDTGDERARRIYETIGVYLGYTVAHLRDFYDLKNLLILGRVTSGPGGEVILSEARKVLRIEFPELVSAVQFHIPSEQDKRHGQAVAAASLPRINSNQT